MTKRIGLIILSINSWSILCLFMALMTIPSYAHTFTDCHITVANDHPIKIYNKNQKRTKQNIKALESMTVLVEIFKETDYILTQSNTGQDFVMFTATPPQDNDLWMPFKIFIEKSTNLNSFLNCDNLAARSDELLRARQSATSLIRSYHQGDLDASFGKIMINLEDHFLSTNHKVINKKDNAIARYQKLIQRTQGIANSIKSTNLIFSQWVNILEQVYDERKENIDYCRDKTLILDALVGNCTNCMGETLLFLGIFLDSGFTTPKDWVLSVEIFRDHIRPVLFNPKTEIVFDLTYGQFGKAQAAIYPWQSYIPAILDKLTTLVLPIEYDSFKTFNETLLDKPMICNKHFSIGDFPRIQLPNLNGYYSCGRFSKETPPKNAETSQRIQKINRVMKKPSLISQVGSLIKVSKLNLSLHKEKINSAKEHYISAHNKFSRQDQEVISLLKAEELSFKDFSNHFDRSKTLLNLGITSDQGSEVANLFQQIKSKSVCRLLPPLTLEHTRQKYMSGKFRGYTFISDDRQLILDMNQLSTNQRYTHLIDWLETNIDMKLAIISKAFDSTNIKDSFLHQTKYFEQIREVDNLIFSYYTIFEKLSHCTNFISYEIRRAPPALLPYSKFPKYREYILSIYNFQKNADNNPHLILPAIIEAQDSLGGQVLKIVPSAISGTLDALRLLNGTASVNTEPAPFYKKFTDYFLLNKNVFFVPPESLEEETYGGVRPLSKISVEDFLLKAQPHNYVEINLPQLGFYCEPHDFGYTLRSLFYIDCPASLNQGNSKVQSEDEQVTVPLDRLSTKDTIAEDITASHSINKKHKKLFVDNSARQLIVNGTATAPHTEGLQANYLDQRQKVQVDRQYWPALSSILSPHKDSGLYSVMLHYTQRASIQNLFHIGNGGNIRISPIRPEFLKTGQRKISKDYLERVQTLSIKTEEKVSQLLLHTENRYKAEVQAGVPLHFNDDSFKRAAFNEVLIYRKTNWVLESGYLQTHSFVLPNENNIPWGQIISGDFIFTPTLDLPQFFHNTMNY